MFILFNFPSTSLIWSSCFLMMAVWFKLSNLSNKVLFEEWRLTRLCENTLSYLAWSACAVSVFAENRFNLADNCFSSRLMMLISSWFTAGKMLGGTAIDSLSSSYTFFTCFSSKYYDTSDEHLLISGGFSTFRDSSFSFSGISVGAKNCPFWSKDSLNESKTSIYVVLCF